MVNTQKFMKFEEEPAPEVLEEHKALMPVFSNLKHEPWMETREEFKVIHDRAMEKYTKDVTDCQSWREVHDFMYTGDNRTFDFVKNQLMRLLGIKRKRKDKKRSKSSGHHKDANSSLERTLRLMQGSFKNTHKLTTYTEADDDFSSTLSGGTKGSRNKKHHQEHTQQKSKFSTTTTTTEVKFAAI